VLERRAFVRLAVLGVIAAPLATAAQPAARTPRIGVLLPGAPATAARNPRIQAFYQSLREFGWVEGQNVVFERRYAEGQYGRLSALATELARLNVDVIVTASTPPAQAAKSATTSIPIVILDPGDPVATGLVTSLARPGGNVTGVSSIAPDLAAKRLEMLKEAAPKTSRVAVVFNAAIPPGGNRDERAQSRRASVGPPDRIRRGSGPEGLRGSLRDDNPGPGRWAHRVS
jgi:putative ABC transport system substrate-binding protein